MYVYLGMLAMITVIVDAHNLKSKLGGKIHTVDFSSLLAYIIDDYFSDDVEGRSRSRDALRLLTM